MTKKKPTKGKKIALLDLDNSDADADGGDDEAMAEKENKALEQLEKALGDCQKCGPSKLCKINKNGQHVNLTFNQRRGWSVALVCSLYFISRYNQIDILTQAIGTHGITLRTPPKGELFADFHKQPSDTLVDAGSPNAAPGAFGMPSAFPWQQMMPFMMPGMFQAMASAPASPVKPLARPAPPSSDPADQDGAIEHRSIRNFLFDLGSKHPQRGLAAYEANFNLMDYYHVDELANMAQEDLTGRDFSMTPGNAKFIISEAKVEVKRAERAAKRARYD